MMSKYKRFEIGRIHDYPLESRHSKVTAGEFASPLGSDSFSSFWNTLPDILAGRRLRLLVDKIRRARELRRSIIWAFGGHVIKVGLGPLLVDLMGEGFITALATNGSGVIHDFEIALCGKTSEDVEAELKTGRFGMARETGQFLNRSISRGAAQDKGLAESVAEYLADSRAPHSDLSVLVQAWRRDVPITAHVAIGTDITHSHPEASGEAIGKTTLTDFRIFAHEVAALHDGGVFLNLGSAVLLPEVFLKAVSLVRNSGRPLEGFTTANLDFIQHYRPTQNVVRRPVADSGDGIALTGHHEIMIPLLAAALRWSSAPRSAE